MVLSFCSHDEKKNRKEGVAQSNIELKDSLIINAIKDFKFFQKGNYNILETSFLDSKVYFSKNKHNLTDYVTKDLSGKITEYRFYNNELNYILHYYKNSSGSKESTKEVIAFKNGIPDINNSAFIELNLINETDSTLSYEVAYRGGYDFVSGQIFIGDKLFNLADTAGCYNVKMRKVSDLISFPKVEGNNFMNIYIERSLDSEISFRTTHPADGVEVWKEIYMKDLKTR